MYTLWTPVGRETCWLYTRGLGRHAGYIPVGGRRTLVYIPVGGRRTLVYIPGYTWWVYTSLYIG